MLILFILFWATCSILSYGFEFSYWQNQYKTQAVHDYKKDLLFSIVFSISGPIRLIVILILDMYKHGLKFW